MRALPATLLALAAGLALPAAARAAASAWARNPQTEVRLLSADRVAAFQGELRLGVEFRVAPGWHVYWKNSGDAGFAPMVKLAAAPGLGGGELLWPAPHRFELPGGLVAYGYGGEVVYPLRASLALPAGSRGPLRLSADVDYLTCQIDCVPYRYTLTLIQAAGERRQPDPTTEPLLDAWWGRLPVPAESLPGVSTEGVLTAGPTLEVRVRGLSASSQAPEIFLEPNDELSTGRPQWIGRRPPARSPGLPAGGEIVFHVPLTPKVAGRPLPPSATFAWTVTGLARGGHPLAIEARRTVALASSTAAATAEPAKEVEPRETGAALAALLATAALLAALSCWGLLGAPGARSPLLVGLGFGALAAALAPLYALSHSLPSEGLAAIELALLAMALLVWLRRRTTGRRGLRWLLAAGVVACAAAPPWLAFTLGR